jgi:hypothetical protein
MIKNQLLIASLFLTLVYSACKKDSTMTRIGFYCLADSIPGKEHKFRLFVDDEFKGELLVSDTVLPASSSRLFFLTLNSDKHTVDLKDANGTLLSAHFLRVQKNKVSSGTSTDNGKQIDGINNSSFASKLQDGSSLFTFILK